MRLQQGFTLIEVMVALFIAATMAVAVSQVIGQRVELQLASVDRTFTALCARELMARFEVESYWPSPGRQQGELVQGERVCHWQMDVNSTGLRGVRRGELVLFDETDKQRPLDRYSLFLAAP
ncbi:type II secretion system protein [Marinobacterium mangrovicola]|uniref:Type II secretion system protein I (GspI) n=1 Tax=Marinobacterium mangrovicola TaxID=1476959 RepID=A0A4R1G7K0_9GAMM|nr:type II secretion system protein [Marinobacterium mangrovicola]TCK03538.1 type II secretion system protein I (GspI) [Marinobacterium mangrovicola]